MSNSITQDMKYRQSLMKYAEKYGVKRASRKYNKARSYIYFWRSRWDGTAESLACQSRRPHSHPRQHSEEEIKLIRDMRRRNPKLGLTELWYRLKKRGYARTVESLFRCMRREGLIKPTAAKKKHQSKPYEKMTHPGERIQIDVKVVPRRCTAIYTFGTHVSLNSPDAQYGDGTDPVLNKFYNFDQQFGLFLRRFQESAWLDNTVLILTTDHATYADNDFRHAFPTYSRPCIEVDSIPLYIYHKDIQTERLDAHGRNTLDFAPTILDYLDISAPNFFLGTSLFSANEHETVPYSTISYQPSLTISTANCVIDNLSMDEQSAFTQRLMQYIAAKGTNTADFSRDQILSSLSEDSATLSITLISENQYSNVWFPVWSDENGQDDLIFHPASKEENGHWMCSVDLASHWGSGIYRIHAYAGINQPTLMLAAANVYVPVDPQSAD